MAEGIKTQVLIMDDDPALLSVMKEILEAEGYLVSATTLGADALKVMNEKHPSVVFFGNKLPEEVGETFVGWLKQRDPAPRVIAMAPTREALQWAEQIGTDNFLAKPFDAAELLATVRQPAEDPDAIC